MGKQPILTNDCLAMFDSYIFWYDYINTFKVSFNLKTWTNGHEAMVTLTGMRFVLLFTFSLCVCEIECMADLVFEVSFCRNKFDYSKKNWFKMGHKSRVRHIISKKRRVSCIKASTCRFLLYFCAVPGIHIEIVDKSRLSYQIVYWID